MGGRPASRNVSRPAGRVTGRSILGQHAALQLSVGGRVPHTKLMFSRTQIRSSPSFPAQIHRHNHPRRGREGQAGANGRRRDNPECRGPAGGRHPQVVPDTPVSLGRR